MISIVTRDILQGASMLQSRSLCSESFTARHQVDTSHPASHKWMPATDGKEYERRCATCSLVDMLNRTWFRASASWTAAQTDKVQLILIRGTRCVHKVRVVFLPLSEAMYTSPATAACLTMFVTGLRLIVTHNDLFLHWLGVTATGYDQHNCLSTCVAWNL